MSRNIGTHVPAGTEKAMVREFAPRYSITFRQIARALGAKQHRWNDDIRFIGSPEHAGQLEIVGMPLTESTFVVYLRFPTLVEKASRFADVVGDRY